MTNSLHFISHEMLMSLRTSIAPALLLLAACSTDSPTAPAKAELSPSLQRTPVSLSVVMRNLNSPRGLAWGLDGGLYVAEAGTTTVSAVCAPVARGANCYSGTGSISRLKQGRQERIVSNLPSAYNAAASDIVGPHDVGFTIFGNTKVSIGWGADPAARAALGALGRGFGSILSVRPNGSWRVVADVSAFETANNPAGGPVDSNPYGLLDEIARQYIVDAGGNSLLRVRPDGQVSLVAVFPSVAVAPGPFNPPFARSEAVPTEVQRGPDGALYVSTLSGVPFLPGAAIIYRVVEGEAPTVYAAGLTQITDFTFGADGTLYVLQYGSGPFFNGPGAVVKQARDGTRTVLTTALTRPTGILLGAGGTLYVSNFGNAASVGEVVKIVQ